MRGIPLWIGLLVAVLGLGTTTAVRASDTCVGSCIGDLTGCVQDARNDKLVCRDDCRTNGGGGPCMRDCRVEGGTQRKACRSGAKECVTACGADANAATAGPSGPGASCQGQCGQALSQCLRDASSGLPACLDTCPASGSGRNKCVKACEDLVASGSSVCNQQHKACLAGCAGATTSSTIASSTTTSSSSTTVTSTSSTVVSTTSSTTVTSTSSTVVSTTTSTTLQNLCGNTVIDPGEECDTNDFGGATCPGSSTGAFLVCTPECTIDFSGCPGATTTSTIVATTSSTSTSSSSTTTSTVATTTSSTVVSTTTSTTLQNLCGNTVIDPGEECDTNDFGGATCPGSSTGAFLVCTAQCTIDFSGCPGATTTSTIAGTTSSTSTSSTSSSTVSTTTSSTLASSTTSTSVASTSSTSTSSSIATTTSSSTTSSIVTTTSSSTTSSIVTTTSSSTSSSIATTTSTSSTTSTTVGFGTVLSFITGPAGGICGHVKSGGTNGTTRKSLTCGGLNVGGGNSTVAEGPTPSGAETQMNLSGGPTFTLSGRTAAQTGSSKNCSDTNCIFGPWLPITNAGTSTCVQNTFAAPASGTLDSTSGDFDGSFPLTSNVFLTANGSSPCPKCIGGTVGMTGTGSCDPSWRAGTGNPYPDSGKACTPVNASGNTYDCAPPAATNLPAFPVDLTPITTGTAFFFASDGLFCPGQTDGGAFGCGSPGSPSICPGAPFTDITYVDEVGSPTGPVTTETATTLASVFCIPEVGGTLGFLINGAANLPGPGATSLPGTLTILP